MKVFNKTASVICVTTRHKYFGRGAEVEIGPGDSSEIKGPYLGEMDNGECYLCIPGNDVVCQDVGPGEKNGFYVSLSKPLYLDGEDFGLIIGILQSNQKKCAICGRAIIGSYKKAESGSYCKPKDKTVFLCDGPLGFTELPLHPSEAELARISAFALCAGLYKMQETVLKTRSVIITRKKK